MDPVSPRVTVLVLENEEPICALMTEVLAGAGYSVLQASDGIAGLALLDRQPVDLIVCDELMPRMNGMEFCNRLAQHPDYQTIPIILTSGYSVPSSKTSHYSAFLAKPFDVDDLLMMVASALAESRSRQLERAANVDAGNQ